MKFWLLFLLFPFSLLAAPVVRFDSGYDNTTNYTIVAVHNHSDFSDFNPDPGPNKTTINIMKNFIITNGFGGAAITEHGGFATDPGGHGGVFITGQEITQTKHILALFTSSLVSGDYPATSTDWQAFFLQINSKSGVGAWAHPNSASYLVTTNLMASVTNRPIPNIEVYNAITMDLSNTWDQAIATNLWDGMLRMGYRPYGYSGLDQHTFYMASNGWNQVFLGATNLNNIKSAWTNGNFTFGRATLMWIGVTNDTVTCTVNSNCVIAAVTNGIVAASTTGTSLSYTALGNETYVRFSARQTANTNLFALSQPLYPYITNLTLTLNVNVLNIGP